MQKDAWHMLVYVQVSHFNFILSVSELATSKVLSKLIINFHALLFLLARIAFY